MRRLGLFLLLAVAQSAAAQTGTLAVEFQNEAELIVGPSQCGATVPVDWTANAGGQACEDLKLWVTSRTTCGETPQSGDLDLGAVTVSELATGSGRKTFQLSALTGISGGADAGTGCGAVGFEQTFIGCGRYKVSSGFPATCTSGISNSTLPKLIYDAKAPPIPTLEALIPLDGALSARVVTTGDTSSIVLFVKESSAPDSAYALATTFSSEASSGRIDGLQNGTSYSVKAYAEDLVENRSEASAVLSAIPVNSEGFYGNYRRMGGAEDGGCSAVGGGSVSLALLGLLAGALFRRRR